MSKWKEGFGSQAQSPHREVSGQKMSGKVNDDAVVPPAKKVKTSADGMTQTEESVLESDSEEDFEANAIVPMVRVWLVQSLRLPPCQCALARVGVENNQCNSNPLLLDNDQKIEESIGVHIGDALLQPSEDGIAYVLIATPTGFTQRMEVREVLGKAVQATVVCAGNTESSRVFIVWAKAEGTVASNAITQEKARQKKLKEILGEPDLPDPEKETLLRFLTEHHYTFCLEEGEGGETDLIQMEIDTGDAYPKKHPVRRMPFAVRQELASQLHDMQDNSVIQPSRYPWLVLLCL